MTYVNLSLQFSALCWNSRALTFAGKGLLGRLGSKLILSVVQPLQIISSTIFPLQSHNVAFLVASYRGKTCHNFEVVFTHPLVIFLVLFWFLLLLFRIRSRLMVSLPHSDKLLLKAIYRFIILLIGVRYVI